MKTTLWRPLAIIAVLVAWLAIGGIGGPLVGQLSEVQTNDSAAFLPSSAESTEAAAAYEEFSSSDTFPGILVFDEIDDFAAVQEFVGSLGELDIVDGVTVGDLLANDELTVIPSDAGDSAVAIVQLDAEKASERYEESSVPELFSVAVNEAWEASGNAGEVYVTGAVGFAADLVAAFAGIDGILLLVALIVVFVILIIVYRSPVLPIFVLLTSVFALGGAVLVVYNLAANGMLTLNGQAQGIMFILVVGATTDYALLLVARYREELIRHESAYQAMWVAWRRSLEPIGASAGTVILGLLTLLLSDLASNQSLGPVAAIGIAAAFLAALTMLPALLLVGGRRSRFIYWPRKPKFYPEQAELTSQSLEELEAQSGVWGRVSRAVGTRPRLVGSIALLVLVVLAAFLPTLQANGTGQDEVLLGEQDSTTGLGILEEDFDLGGSTEPVVIIADEASADDVVAAVQEVEGISAAYVLNEAILAGAPPEAVAGALPPTVIDGSVAINAVSDYQPTTEDGIEQTSAIREAVHAVDETALVGGSAAESYDVNVTSERDLRVIIPSALAVIFVVLILLLRALVAPAVVIAANLVSFAATLGLSAIFFNWVFDFPGADPAVPLFGFIFLVALGVDYSIFLMSRAREECVARGTRPGVRVALAVTGGVITSAGIVLAATFSALAVLPLLFLAQIAFIVSVGVLIDTFVVRTVLVPAAITDLGRISWWPWHKKISD